MRRPLLMAVITATALPTLLSATTKSYDAMPCGLVCDVSPMSV